jgi:hypothetical protein
MLVHGWVERVRPPVFVLTDGSGRTGKSRLDLTAELLATAGAQPGGVFGRLTDQAVYEAMLRQDASIFRDVAHDLASALVRDRVDYIVCDAAEGYNPAHDLCRPIVAAACGLARLTGGHEVAQWEFPVSRLAGLKAPASPDEVVIRLDDGALARKAEAARRYSALQGEVDQAAGQGLETFRVERFRRVGGWDGDGRSDEPPEYERIGEARVALGHYAAVIRWRDHMVPLADALRTLVHGPDRCAS